MTFALIFMSFMLPICTICGFITGFNLQGKSTGYIIKTPEIEPLFDGDSATAAEVTERERIQAIIDSNIDNYGTDRPQKEVK